MKKTFTASIVIVQLAFAGDPDSTSASAFRFDPAIQALFVEGTTIVVYNYYDLVLDADLFQLPSWAFSSIGIRAGVMRTHVGFWGASGESNPNDHYSDSFGLFARATHANQHTRIDLFLGYAIEQRPHFYPRTVQTLVGGIEGRWIFFPPVLGLVIRFMATPEYVVPNVGLCLGYFR